MGVHWTVPPILHGTVGYDVMYSGAYGIPRLDIGF